MGLVSFIGRLLFASLFILSAYQGYVEFGTDGGPAAEVLKPKLNMFTNLITSKFGIQVPEIDTKHVILSTVVLKGLGGVAFILGSYTGAILLLVHQLIFTPVLYNFYNYNVESTEYGHLFTKFTQNMAVLGALLFFIGMKHSISLGHRKKNPKIKTG